MGNKPRVSIGLPVFNGENYLAATLDSLLAQSFTDFEVIVSDNASTDRTQEIYQAYAARDQRIRYYRNEANIGAAPNCNRAFELSSGEYFKWASHDDLCAPEYLERCVDLLDREPNAIMCYPRTVLIDGQGEVIKHYRGVFIEYYQDGFDLRSPRPHERFRQFLRRPPLCNPIFGLVRSATLRNTSLMGSYVESDKVLLGEFALLGKCYEVPECLFYRRIHPGNAARANPTLEQLTAWFDPTARPWLTPRRRLFLEFVRIIWKTPMGWQNRILCFAELGHYYLVSGRFGVKAGDLRQGVGQCLRSLSEALSLGIDSATDSE